MKYWGRLILKCELQEGKKMPKTKLKTVLLAATPNPEQIVSMGAKLCYSQSGYRWP